ncbi:MAG: metallophosphoesterase family protein [Armatimonadetes bacterium]|nr:metallophosphoesterase family protein [Armatimonadota bacterium]
MNTAVPPFFLLLSLLFVFIQTASAAKPELRFGADGTFKIVTFSDIQDDESLDPRSTALMERVLDAEKPDMVVIIGDCIAGYAIDTVDQVKQAIASISVPMEKRRIPWAIVFGNHDMEHQGRTKMDKSAVIEFYSSFPCNLNVRGPEKIHGVGNDHLLVKNSAGTAPALALWLIDSGMYAPAKIGGYDWIHATQVNWYCRTSTQLQAKYGLKIPGLMFFHIPIQEFRDLAQSGKYKGDRFEPEGCSKIHSSLFASVLARGDVKGIFCGHEHISNYVGEWHGVTLGYDASVTYSDYNLPDNDPAVNRTRGGRVLLIKESDPGHFATWMRFTDNTTNQ